MADDSRLADAARRWNQSRILASRLRDARAAYLCERAREGFTGSIYDKDYNHTPGYMAALEEPCWKRGERDYEGDWIQDPPETWCVSCRTRQAIHEAYRVAVTRRGARMRAVQQLARGEPGA